MYIYTYIGKGWMFYHGEQRVTKLFMNHEREWVVLIGNENIK